MDRTFIPTSIPNLGRMHWLAAKKIFDELTAYEEAELDMGIDKWVHRPDLTPVDRLELLRIVNALQAYLGRIEPYHGLFMKAKFYHKKFGIRWWKHYRAGLPYIKIDPMTGAATSG